MITVIDYGVGNIGSVANMLKKLGYSYRISDKKKDVKSANLLILPGVGAAREGMKNLRKNDLAEIIKEKIGDGTPFLGICLGMQLLFEESEEGNTKCLGILKGKVIKFKKATKIPQIGWNTVEPQGKYFYFVNSYFCVPNDNAIVMGKTFYGEKFASVIQTKNILATQFHPEKSSIAGFAMIQKFIENNI